MTSSIRLSSRNTVFANGLLLLFGLGWASSFTQACVSAIACTTHATEVIPGEMADMAPDDLGSGQYLNVTNSEPAISGAWEVVVF